MAQERAVATRDAVLKAAAEVFERRGYYGASIAEMLELAGVTKGAMYFHFPSKEALAVAIVNEQSNWRDSVIEGDRVPNLQDAIDLSYRFATALQADPLVRASIRLTLEYGTFGDADASAYSGWVDEVERLLEGEKSVADGLLPDVDIPAASRVIVGIITGLQLLSEATSGRKDLPALLEMCWRMVLPGIARPERIAELNLAAPKATRTRKRNPKR